MAQTQWKYGPPTDPGFFPIAVWLQSPANAVRFQAVGINLYVGLWQGPTDEQLAQLKAARMPVICAQNAVGLAHRDDPTIIAWMHGDEPDNAQEVTDPATGKKSWGPCVPPEKIVADYRALRTADPNRPILLNLGQGVANDRWVGRGTGAKQSDYLTYVQGADIVSFDVYPVVGGLPLWYVPQGVERLRRWSSDRKPIWSCIECTAIDGKRKATPQQVHNEVWMALIQGARGLIYFVHQFQPRFNEHALLDDPAMRTGVTATNRLIRALAPVLNSPTRNDLVTISGTDPAAQLTVLTKRHGSATYLFAAGMRGLPTAATFQVSGLPREATAEVLGEGRTIPVRDGRFDDPFPADTVHLYRIRATDKS